MDAQHPNVPFPNLEGDRFKNIWTTFLQRPDGKTCDVIVSTKPSVGRISPPLLHISGVSNDFSSASGQWQLCPTLDLDVRQKQRELVDRLLADDHSTLLRSAEAAHLTPEYKMRHLDLCKDLSELVSPQDRRAAVEYSRLRPATEVTTTDAIPPFTPINPVDDHSAPTQPVTERVTQSPPPYDHLGHSVHQGGKSKKCNPAVTFDTFVEKRQLVDGDQQECVRCRHCDQLLKWIKKRLETPKMKEKRRIAEGEAECKRHREENFLRMYPCMYDTS
jgi:hypothetical protein